MTLLRINVKIIKSKINVKIIKSNYIIRKEG